MDDNSLDALLIAKRETFRTTTTVYCHQRWITSRTIMGYGPPPPAAAQDGQPDDGPTEQDGPVEQGESTSFGPTISVGQIPLGPTINTRSVTARQLQMDNLTDHRTPAKGRDPPTDKEGRGTTNYPHKHSLPSMQVYDTGGATKWKQHHADDTLAPTESHETRRQRTQAIYPQVFSRR